MALRSNIPKRFSSALLGAAFLMATSAIGPGFITQTTVFTEQLLTSFAFVILCSILLDIVVQMNIWRVISVSGKTAQDLSNEVFRGAGYVLSFLIVIGGLAFNIGNIAGAALGLQVLAGLDLWAGALISTVIALVIFWVREAGTALDRFAKVSGLVMIGLTAYIAISSHPPLGMALRHSIVPEEIDTTAIIVLVGGTVGGYISFAGAHRLLDAGVRGPEHIATVSRYSVRAILLAGVMRVLLFLAALGIVHAGATLDPENPPASVFRIAGGEPGYRIFGVVFWCAAITSVVGSAYTSISFVRTFHPFLERNYRIIISVFILFSTGIFLWVGRPVALLVVVGALNGFILPVSLTLILLAAYQKRLMGSYRHPVWLSVTGWAVMLLLLAISIKALTSNLTGLW